MDTPSLLKHLLIHLIVEASFPYFLYKYGANIDRILLHSHSTGELLIDRYNLMSLALARSEQSVKHVACVKCVKCVKPAACQSLPVWRGADYRPCVCG